MKKLLNLIVVIMCCIQLSAQVQTRIFPNKNAIDSLFIIKNNNYSKKVVHTPFIVNAKLANNQVEKMPFRFGEPIDVHYSLKDGIWENTQDGRIWTLTIESTEAASMSLVLRNFTLPEDAQLYIMNKEETMLYGPVTKQSICEGNDFMTSVLEGSNITLFLFEPYRHKGESSLEIKRVICGFEETDRAGTKNVRSSDCSLNVACYPEWNLEADATGLISCSNGYGGSGALVITTDNSFKGYFLTAKHVVENSNTYTVDFFYRRQGCSPSSPCYQIITCNNVVVKAIYDNADMALLEILDLPLQNQRLAWLGWDRTESVPYEGTTIHYPHLYDANIAFDYNYINSYNNSNYWKVSWDESVARTGSSGAPLLDQNKRVIGQLYATLNPSSQDDCENKDCLVGKFSRSWTGGNTNLTGLSNWLDSIGTNATTTNTRRMHDPTFSGPQFICSSTGTFTISDFPPGAYTTWTLSDGLGPTPPFLQYNDSVCIVTNNGAKSYTGILEAKIYWDGYLLKELQQRITTYSGFYGVYNGNNELPSTVWVNKGGTVNIKSPNLVRKIVTHSVTMPSNWQYYGDTGSLSVTYPNVQTNNPIIINIQNDTYYSNCDNNYAFAIMPTSILYSYTIKTNFGEGTANIELVPQIDEETKRVLNDYSIQYTEMKDLNWTVEIYNAVTGEKKITQNVLGNTLSLNTSGWKRGLYVARVVVGDKVMKEKIQLR